MPPESPELTSESTVKQHTRSQRVLRWTLTLFFSLVVLVGLLLGSFSVVMARVPAYRAQMQTWLSEQAKLDIRFASITAGWRGYGPELRFTQAEVRSADQQRILAIADQGSAGFDLWQALRTWRIAAARLSLEGTELKIQRLRDGRFELVGQADWPEYESDRAFQLDALPVGELDIRRVRISYRDLKTGLGPWLLNDMNLRVTRDISRGRDVLTLRGEAILPRSLGKTLMVEATAQGSLTQLAQLQWQATVNATQIDLAGWEHAVLGEKQARNRGVGTLTLQTGMTGLELTSLAADIHVDNLELTPPTWKTPLPVADPLVVREDRATAATPRALTTSQVTVVKPEKLQYQMVDLAFRSQLTPAGWQTHVDRLQLNTDTRTWPKGRGALTVLMDDQDAPVVRQASGWLDHVVLDTLWPLLAFLPDNERNAKWRALNLSGGIDRIAFEYEQPEQAPPRYGLRADIRNFGVSPIGRAPGLTGLSGTLQATGARGQLIIDSRDMEFSLPHVFRTPLPADVLTGTATWTRDASGTQIKLPDLAVSNADGRAQAAMTLTLPADGSSPLIDMTASGDQLHADAAPRYMPAGVMHKHSLAWLDAAFSKGIVQHADATLRGPLRQFPFRRDEGLFLITADISNLSMAFHPDYLPASGLMVKAEFRNEGMHAVANAGDLQGLALLHAEGDIADFHDSELRIKARLSGDLGDGIRYVQQSPIGPKLGTLFQQLQGAGRLATNADLFLPLQNMHRYRFDLDAQLDKAHVAAQDISEVATNVAGKFHVRNDAVTMAALQGDFLRGSFVARTQQVGKGQFNVVFNGNAQADGVRRLLKLPAWIQLEGSTAYRFTLPGYASVDSRGVHHLYSVDSDLKGLRIALPEPAGKAADTARALHLEADMPQSDVMLLRGSVGPMRTLVQLRQQDTRWRFNRAGLRADAQSASLPADAGLRIEGRVDQVVLDDWLKLGTTGNAASVAAGTAGNSTTQVQDVLRSANLSIGKFSYLGFTWSDLRGVLQATEQGWRVDVSGMNTAGQVLVPYSFDTGKPVTLNMDQLHLMTAASGSNANKNNTSEMDPRELPGIHADIRHFRFDEHDFGALRGTATRTAKGLLVNETRISGDTFQGTATGSWFKTAEGSLCSINLALDSTDVRATMQRFNYGDFISGKHGKLIASLNWPKGVDADLLGRASGSLEFQLNDGQILSLQPGAGRVLGLLSVAALPRRLGLDFRDLTDKGLAYDTIHADFTVTRGDARTQNLVLRGPAVEVGIVGRMGLGARDYDQTAVVSGEVGNALPVAGTAIGGPVVGAALLLFSKVFKEPLKGAARAYYHIGGTWDDPKVERIDADAAKAAEAAGY